MRGGKRGGKKTRTHKKRGGMSCPKRGGKKTRTHKKRGGKKTLMQRLGL